MKTIWKPENITWTIHSKRMKKETTIKKYDSIIGLVQSQRSWDSIHSQMMFLILCNYSYFFKNSCKFKHTWKFYQKHRFNLSRIVWNAPFFWNIFQLWQFDMIGSLKNYNLESIVGQNSDAYLKTHENSSWTFMFLV